MTRSLRTVGALAAAALFTIPTAGPVFAAENDLITLYNINDFHGRITESGLGLACTLETQRANESEAVAGSFFLSAGDNVGATEFASFIQQDQPTIDFLNALGLDSSAVGNHEFDQGYADITDRLASKSSFEILGANVYKADGTRALPAYSIEERGEARIAVIGVVTEQTSTLVSPAGIKGLTFTDPVAEVNKVVEEIKASGEQVDLIVAEYHDGSSQSGGKGEAVGGALMDRIVNETSADVDAIFTGHTHAMYEFTAHGRPIIQTGSYGENLASVTFVEKADGSYELLETALFMTQKSEEQLQDCMQYPAYAEASRIVSEAEAKAEELGSKPVGSVAADVTTAWGADKAEYVDGVWTKKDGVDAPKGDDRSASSALSNIAAQSQVWALEKAGKKADIGIMVPGSIRAELFKGEDGVISLQEANDVMPFNNNVHTVDLTGAQFVRLLEQQWQPDGASRPFLQLGLSKNVAYTFDPTAERGKRIVSVEINGEPLDLEATYTIVGQSFVLDGGDNFTALTEGTNRVDTGLLDRDTWMDYLEAHPNLEPDYSQRALGISLLNPEDLSTEKPLKYRFTGLHSTSLGAPKIESVALEWNGSTVEAPYLVDEEGVPFADVTLDIPECTEAGEYPARFTAKPDTGSVFTLVVSVEGDSLNPDCAPVVEEDGEPTPKPEDEDSKDKDEESKGKDDKSKGDKPKDAVDDVADVKVPVKSAPKGSGVSELPRTGVEAMPVAIGAAALITLGIVIAAAARGRRR